MRLVSIPAGLTPRRLLELRGISTSLADQLRDKVSQDIDSGKHEDVLSATERIFPAARTARDSQAQALVYLYKAEVLYRLSRWEEALEHTRQALAWLRNEVTQIAAYNRAVALYFEGMLHFVLRADGNVLSAFDAAQDALVESERFWGYEKNNARVADCQSIGRWMSKLRKLLLSEPSGDLVMIVPVYERSNRTLILIDAMSIPSFLIQLPKIVLTRYMPVGYVPLQIETLLFLKLWPATHYLALQILRDGDLLRQSHAGDKLLIEATSPLPPQDAVKLTQDLPFVRHPDGKIVFGPYEQQNEIFTGIPRLLIKKHDEP